MNATIQNVVFLTATDAVLEKGMPSMSKVIDNTVASVGYENVLRVPIQKMVDARTSLETYKNEVLILGKVLGLSLGSWVSDRYITGGKSTPKQYLIKSALAVGGEFIFGESIGGGTCPVIAK